MDKFMARVVAAAVLFAAASLAASAQGLDRKDVRSGNRHFSKEKYREAIVDYQKALLRDSTSFAASYNLANALYRTGNFTEAGSVLDSISGRADESGYAADYHYNAGNTALALKDYQAAVDSYRAALLRNPGDLDAKENYIYARKKLEEQQNNQDQNQDQNKDQNKDQNQDQNQDQNKNQDQNQDQNKDQNQNQDNSGNEDRNGGQAPQDQPAISRQAAQQMLNAMMAKEKETQDKVKKEKAAVMKSRQKEKNW